MKARLAKKILLGTDKKKRYWLKRKEDHRVVKALQIYLRKRRKGVSYE